MRAGFVVEGCKWLIKKENSRAKGKRPSQCHALPFSATQIFHRPVEQMLNTQQPGQFGHACINGVRGFSPHGQSKGQLLEYGHRLEERAVLGDIAHIPGRGGGVREISAIEHHTPGIRQTQSTNNLKQRGLARARTAHQNGIRPARNLKMQVAQREVPLSDRNMVQNNHSIPKY